MKFIGYYNPLGKEIGFCEAIFQNDAGDMFFQEATGGTICRISSANHVREFAQLYRYEKNVALNDDAIYVFYFGNGPADVVVGDYDLTAQALKERINEVKFSPHLFRDVGYFLENEMYISAALEQIEELYQNDFGGYNISPVIATHRPRRITKLVFARTRLQILNDRLTVADLIQF